jgi:MoaA/NifB/PqqE/SkfB family radical SAM enzyme
MNETSPSTTDLSTRLDTIDIELSGYCNANCIFCPRDKMTREKANLKEEFFDQLLREVSLLRPMGPRAFYLTGLGEPLYNKNIVNFAGSIRRIFPGTQIAVTSNATLLTLELCEAILGSEINSFQCSIPTINESEYETIMGNRHFQSVVHWMTYLAERKKSAGLEVSVTIVRTTQTDQEVQEYRNFWERRSVCVSERKVHNRGGFLDSGDSLEIKNRFGCALFNARLFVAGNGDILACCHDLDGLSCLGTIGVQFLSAMLSAKTEMVRKQQLFPMCAKCNDSCGQY